MPPYRNLRAWEHAQRLAVECSKAARRFPDYEQGVLADQMRRACYSIPLNIAEGSARKGSREYRRFLDTAKGSLAELETIIDLSHDLGYMDDVTHSRLTDVATETGKTLYGLLRKISDAARRSS
ncbi:MAG: four helix bundle protein [Gemmatimonadales bacterium]